MEDNQDKKQDGGKGLLIIIAIVILAVAAYFIVQGVNKKDKGSNQPTVSISEEDKLELSSLNLQGKWNKKVGDSRYELNFKSTKELVLTQYDKNDEISVKSDEGTYSVDNGVLNLTVVANGQTSTAAATAVLSDKYLIITVIEGSEIFAGTYTADREGISDVDNSGAESGTNSSDASNTNDTSDYEHLSSRVDELLNMTADELFAQSSTTPARYDYTHAPGGCLMTIDGYSVGCMFNFQMHEDGVLETWGSEEEAKLFFMTVPTEMFFASGNAKGKPSYTFEELQAIYGNKLKWTYSGGSDEYYSGGYQIIVEIDGHTVQFNDDRDAPLPSLESPITNVLVYPAPETEDTVDNSVYQYLSSNVTELFAMTPQELMAASSTTPHSSPMGSMQVTINGYTIWFGFSDGSWDNNGNYNPTDSSYLDSIFVPCEMFFSYPADSTHGDIKGKQSYTYEELEAIYGDKLSNFYVEPGIDAGGYRVGADINGYYVTFSSSASWTPLYSLDEPITYCALSLMP